MKLKQTLIDQQFPFIEDVALVFAGGSHQHGARLTDTGDVDIFGVYVAPPTVELSIGLEDRGHFTAGSSDQYTKNKPGDTDCKLYTLRRWANLALKGNPNVLSYLFVPPTIQEAEVSSDVWDKFILPNRKFFLAKTHASAFLGLGDSQYHRMIGIRGTGKHGQRDDQIEQFGYDAKAGMHMIRSMTECLELLQTGHMTFPRPDKDVLIEIRNGKWTLEQIIAEYQRLRLAVQAAELDSPLPDSCNREFISSLIVEAILYHWEKRRYL